MKSDSLTRAELDILQGLADGRTNREIADTRGTGLSTVRTQIADIKKKLGVTSRSAAVVQAYKQGLVVIDPTPEQVVLHRLEQLLQEIVKQPRRGHLSREARLVLESFERVLQERPRSDQMSSVLDRVVDSIYKRSMAPCR